MRYEDRQLNYSHPSLFHLSVSERRARSVCLPKFRRGETVWTLAVTHEHVWPA